MNNSPKSRVAPQEKRQLYKKFPKVYFMIKRWLRPTNYVIVSLKDYLRPKAISKSMGRHTQCQRHPGNNFNDYTDTGNAVVSVYE